MIMLNDEEKFDMAILAEIEILTGVLEDRAKPNTRRWNKIQNIKKAIYDTDETYHGSVDPEFDDTAEKFYAEVRASLNKLLKTIKHGEGENNGQTGEVNREGTGSTGGCGEVLQQGKRRSGDQAATGNA